MPKNNGGNDLYASAGRLIRETGEKVKTVDDMLEETAVLCEAFNLVFFISLAVEFTEDGSMYHKSMASNDQQHLLESAKSLINFMGPVALYGTKALIEQKLEGGEDNATE